jgi:hypothetical protein
MAYNTCAIDACAQEELDALLAECGSNARAFLRVKFNLSLIPHINASA